MWTCSAFHSYATIRLLKVLFLLFLGIHLRAYLFWHTAWPKLSSVLFTQDYMFYLELLNSILKNWVNEGCKKRMSSTNASLIKYNITWGIRRSLKHNCSLFKGDCSLCGMTVAMSCMLVSLGEGWFFLWMDKDCVRMWLRYRFVCNWLPWFWLLVEQISGHDGVISLVEVGFLASLASASNYST